MIYLLSAVLVLFVAFLLTRVRIRLEIAPERRILFVGLGRTGPEARAEMMKRFGEAIKNDFTLEPYFGGTLFKQGTELVALQRGNLEMGNIAAQDISNQLPAWSIVTSAYP